MTLPTDPLLSQQWHLGNTGGLLDLNVRGAWDPTEGQAYTGAGVRVLVIDDAFDYTHSDLAPNYNTGLDFDWDALDNGSVGDHDLDPFGNPGESHGTAVTGIIGADDNGTGAVGVAFDAQLVGYRVYGFISDGWLQDIRDSIHHSAASANADVVNISQGIANDLNSEFGIGYNAVRFDEIETSIGTAVNTGRGGLGLTIVKSAGNSRAGDYDVNADDWTNDTRQVVVAAVNQDGFVSSYSSYGAAVLVSGFGTPGEVVTTDRVGAAGYNGTDFTSGFNGTSAAAPMVSGVVALIYDANPNLGWRDVQSILADSARHVGTDIGSGIGGSERYPWQWNASQTWNGGGRHFSNDYGYGLVDGLAATRLAETWLMTSKPAQTSGNQFTNTMDMLNVATVIPDGNATGTTFTGNAGFDDIVDRVTVQLTFSTTFTADMEIYVISPDGTISELIDDTGGSTDFNGTWTFETQAFRGERAAGTWSVRIVDDAGADVLTVSDIVVTTYGDFSSSDRYVFTNEYSDYAGIGGHTTALTDTNGGVDTINAAAVTSASTIRLDGTTSTIDGVNLTIDATIEHAIGGDGADRLVGNAGNNILIGMRGNDSLTGGLGVDDLRGGTGDDWYLVDRVADTVTENFGEGLDTVYSDRSYKLAAGMEIEILRTSDPAGTLAVTLEGNEFGNRIIGNAGNNVLRGQDGEDRLTGNAGEDELRGGAGIDTMIGGDGNDKYFVDTLGDTVQEDTAGLPVGGNDTVYSTIDYTLGANVEILRLQGGAGLTGNGNELNNKVVGNSGANILRGLNGNDTIEGNDGSDTIVGGAGNDTLTGGSQADLFLFQASNSGADLITDFNKNADRFNLSGLLFTNLVVAPDGDDILYYAGGTIRIDNPLHDLTLAQYNALVVTGGLGSGSSADYVADATFAGITADAILADLKADLGGAFYY